MSTDLEACLSGARVVPVLTVPREAHAAPLADALADAGMSCAEVTLRTPESQRALRAMAAHGGLSVGAGTVLTPQQADGAVDAGAAFLVSPGLDDEVLHAGRELGVPVLPGVATATELMRALRQGISTVKFFPAEPLGGAVMLKALAAPFPGARFVPTGGIGAEQAGGYLALPAVLAVGGSWIAPPELLERGDFPEIRRRAQQAVKLGAP